MLAQQAARLALVEPRSVGHGIEYDIGARGRHDHQAEPQPAAKLLDVPHPLGPLADREIDAIAARQPINALQDQPQAEDAFQLDDHRRLAGAHGHHIAAAHLALDDISLSLEQRLHRRIKVALQRHGTAPYHANKTTTGDNEMTELLDQGAAAIAAAVRTGKTSARDVAEAAIARVEARNKVLTAIVDFDPAEARTAADAIDSRRKQGFDRPLLGVPYTVKDTTWVKGRRGTNGSLLWKDFNPPRQAVAVGRLRNAGGTCRGITNTPAKGAQGPTENKGYGPS